MVTAPVTGNNILAPPRRTGNADTDLAALHEWSTDLFQALVVQSNVIGKTDTLVTALQEATKRLEAAEAKLAAIGALTAMAGPISATYAPSQLADAYNKINAIIAASA